MSSWTKSTEMDQQAWVASKYEKYPAIAALTGLLASSPIPKIFASNAVPFLMWREARQDKSVEARKYPSN